MDISYFDTDLNEAATVVQQLVLLFTLALIVHVYTWSCFFIA